MDFLISDGENSLIIDTKYKLKYDSGHIHEDIRQVSGYARLKKVREKVGFNDDKHIDCLIIYPKIGGGETSINLKQKFDEIKKYHIAQYYKVYKLGVELPIIEKG
ncbi:MAG: hypothetical protein Q4C75_02385 [Bergeyella zoohelcum]|nr:hypothetical protein [Bergeyella zoohelcum]